METQKIFEHLKKFDIKIFTIDPVRTPPPEEEEEGRPDANAVDNLEDSPIFKFMRQKFRGMKGGDENARNMLLGNLAKMSGGKFSISVKRSKSAEQAQQTQTDQQKMDYFKDVITAAEKRIK